MPAEVTRWLSSVDLWSKGEGMTSIIFKRVRVMAPAIAALALVISSPRPVHAADCIGQLGACYQDAASAGDFWAKWTASLDCELDYAGCVCAPLLEA